MTYNPFTRGPNPVGVRTIEFRDDSLAVTQVVEIWYPATERHRGQDLDPRHATASPSRPSCRKRLRTPCATPSRRPAGFRS